MNRIANKVFQLLEKMVTKTVTKQGSREKNKLGTIINDIVTKELDGMIHLKTIKKGPERYYLFQTLMFIGGAEGRT